MYRYRRNCKQAEAFSIITRVKKHCQYNHYQTQNYTRNKIPPRLHHLLDLSYTQFSIESHRVTYMEEHFSCILARTCIRINTMLVFAYEQ